MNVKYLYAIISNMLLGKYYTISKIQWVFQKCIQVGSNRASQVAQWVKNLPTNAGDAGLILGWGRISWSRKWQPIPVFLPGKSHRQRSLVHYSPWDMDMTEHAYTEALRSFMQTTCLNFLSIKIQVNSSVNNSLSPDLPCSNWTRKMFSLRKCLSIKLHFQCVNIYVLESFKPVKYVYFHSLKN